MPDRLTTAKLRRDINARKENEIFTTRDMLHHGHRGAIDVALSTMVKQGVIRRLARGVFVKATCRIIFTPAEIAVTKAKAFGKRILCNNHEETVSHLRPAKQPNTEVFVVEGHSSSFQYGKWRIVMKRAFARKFALGDTLAGTTLRLLWEKREAACNEKVIASARRSLGGQSRFDVRSLLRLLPEWLHSHFVDLQPPGKLPAIIPRADSVPLLD